MITIASVGVFVVALAALVWTQLQMGAVLRTFRESQPSVIPAEPYDDEWIHRALERLTAAVAEGIDNVERNEKRVRGIVRGAQRRYEASDYYDAGVDAEADTLPERDEESGREEGVPPLQPNVESTPEWIGTPWAAVPGIDRA